MKADDAVQFFAKMASDKSDLLPIVFPTPDQSAKMEGLHGASSDTILSAASGLTLVN